MEKKETLITAVKGFIIGGTMLVPGVSGGSMAMILNIYDQLIFAVSSLMKDKRRNCIFLGTFCFGAIFGMVLVAKPILFFIQLYFLPSMFFFSGAVAGSIPLIYKKARGRGFTWKSILYPLIGFLCVTSLSLLPEDLFQKDMGGSINLVLLMAAGLISAIALVLPGISVSYMLLLLGLYDETMRAISQFYLPHLLPLGVGTLIGIILTTKILDKTMNRYPQPTYLIILGFIIGSMFQVFPGIPTGGEIPICMIAFLFAFFLTKKAALLNL